VNAKDDEFIKQVNQNIIHRAVELGKGMGLYHPFIYLNYAGPGKDVFAGYGSENRAQLLKIRQKYDPDRVFSKLQPGSFKI
jgi:FAD/FMN-containing dehydrogenase